MYDKIIELFNENDGILTTKQVEQKGYSRHLLSTMLKKGLIERVENNMYSLKNVQKDEYYLLQLKYPNVVFSYETSLSFHNMLDRTPVDINVTIPTSYSGSDLKKEKNVVVYYAKDNIYNKGIVAIKTSYGNVVRSYSIEKTICDIINDDKMVNKQIYLDAIKKYVKMKDKDLILLEKYAKMYNIESKLSKLLWLVKYLFEKLIIVWIKGIFYSVKKKSKKVKNFTIFICFFLFYDIIINRLKTKEK